MQRPFVWPDSKVRDLLDSMLKGYPIGYITLWSSPEDYNNTGHIGTDDKIYKRPDDIDAVCEIHNSKFVVLKGRLIATVPRNAANSKKYNHDTYAAFIDASGKTTQNIPFESPSGAAAFVIYGSSDGKVDWKDSQKQPMKNFMP